MKVVEIFSSIQGEGYWLGTNVTFIRLAGCNLRCSFCDTDFSHGEEMTVEQVVAEVLKVSTGNTVVITGGEPTINPQFKELCVALKVAGFFINLETNGTSAVSHELVDWITCSPKADADYKCLCDADEIKLVVTPEFDYEDPRINALATRFNTVWLQPEGSQMQEMWHKADTIVHMDNRFRVGVQLHKLMEVR